MDSKTGLLACFGRMVHFPGRNRLWQPDHFHHTIRHASILYYSDRLPGIPVLMGANEFPERQRQERLSERERQLHQGRGKNA